MTPYDGENVMDPVSIMAYQATVRSACAIPGVQHLIAENQVIWMMKFEDQTAKLETTIEINTCQVMMAIENRDGPYQNILDPYIRETWKIEVCNYFDIIKVSTELEVL